MTDTTDTKALRDSAECMANLLDNLAGYEPSDIDMDAVELRFEDESGCDTGCDISIVGTAQQSADIIRALLDQLEAERQRADALQTERDEFRRRLKLERSILEDADKEIAKLKGEQVPVAFDADIIRDANRYRFLRDEDAWGEDSDSWDVETRTGLISSENLMGGLSPDHFDAAIDARMAASDIPFLNPVTAPQKPNVLLGHIKISEVVAAVSLDQNRKWNGRVGYMAGWNACIDAAIASVAGIVKTEGDQ